LPEVESRGHLFQKFPALRMLPDVKTRRGRKHTHIVFPPYSSSTTGEEKKQKKRFSKHLTPFRGG